MSLVEVRNRNLTLTKLSDTGLLEAVFPQTPYLPGGFKGTYNDGSVNEAHRVLTNGVVGGNASFGPVSLDFTEAPDLSHLANGENPSDSSPVAPGGQAPAIGSPGAGSFNPLDVPSSPGTPNSSGAGSLVVPATTSQQIATQVGGGPAKNLGVGESGIQI